MARERGATPEETLERFRRAADRTSPRPPPLDSRLVEAIVHGEDIRRPLGLTGSCPTEALERSLRLEVATPATVGGGKERVAGLRLVTTDADVDLGEGPEARGPVLALLLAVCGRSDALGELDGSGAAGLRG